MGRQGSSPLTRGKRVCLLDDLGQVRLIPAHAGKTPGRPPWLRGHGAHPRSRGENSGRDPHGWCARGSSPLTRGKPIDEVTDNGAYRLIPAHAGKTPCQTVRFPLTRAHPRSRGENNSRPQRSHRRCGSSPLTRGKHSEGDEGADCAGLIPAHAGKTSPLTVGVADSWAHPRSRGENQPCQTPGRSLLGSSPLTRGKLSRP